MKNRLFSRLSIVFFWVLTCGLSYASSDDRFSYLEGDKISFKGGAVKIEVDAKMYSQIFFNDDPVSLNSLSDDHLSTPSNFLIVNGAVVTDFAVDFDRVITESINNEFGTGQRISIVGIAKLDENIKIEKNLLIDSYNNYPNSFITTVSYKNVGEKDFLISKTISNAFRMDAAQVTPRNKPYNFWSFQGASVSWGKDYVLPIVNGFKQENWMGVQPETKTGGGIPFVDIWNERGGLAIAHIARQPQLVSFPVEVDLYGKVNMSIQKDLDITLAKGESYECLRSLVVAHTLDYYEPLETFSRLMAAQGIKQKNPSDEAHEAIWCGWGYLTDFTLDEIYETLPKLKELGIKWVVIDDRWWDKYGDWNIRDYTFPKGESQVRQFVDSLHSQGFKVKIWWAPTPVQPEVIPNWGGSVDPGMAEISKKHPEWLIMDKDGGYPRDSRDMYQFCPSVPEVQDYMKELTTRFIDEWGFDGHKLDAYYVVPPCYNRAHNHDTPEESYQDLPKLLEVIYETSKSIKPCSVTELCNCGTTQDFYQSIYTDQPVVSDPTSVEQSRRRVKSMKALWGSNAPVYTDHVEHIRLEVDMSDNSHTAVVGQDFATSMGTGGVIGTKFTWPNGFENMQLTGEKEKHWQKWFKLYNEKMLSKGSYLNLYDIIYDLPETHVIQKGENFYYAFYAEQWQGKIELRGLKNKKYKVIDYVNNKNLGTIQGPLGEINPKFSKHLLIECIPVE